MDTALPLAVEFDPDRLLNKLIELLEIKDDSTLAHMLGVNVAIINAIRAREFPVEGMMLLRMQEVSGLSVEELRAMMGDHRNRIRMVTESLKSQALAYRKLKSKQGH